MCGICGIATADGHADVEALRAMSAQLVHRGPDSAGEHVDREVALGSRRLSIIDLAGGDQPIANEDGSVVVVQNGEIYNYLELRDELSRAGHAFRTHSDTEALVHLYEEHGMGFAERLRGMFAVAIWDSSRRRLVLARDRYGIKPLYYRAQRDTIEFASARRDRPGGARVLPGVQLDPGALFHLPRYPQASGGLSAGLGGVGRGRPGAVRAPRPRTGGRGARR